MLHTSTNDLYALIQGRVNKLKLRDFFYFFLNNDGKKIVDLADQLSSYYSCLRKNITWNRKMWNLPHKFVVHT